MKKELLKLKRDSILKLCLQSPEHQKKSENNNRIISYNEVLPSLNDIFIKLVESTNATTRAFENI